MTIYMIKQRLGTGTHYFDKQTLKFFGQTLKDFRVQKIADNKYLFYASSYWNGKLMGISQQVYNASTNELENVPAEYEISIAQYKGRTTCI